MLKPIHTAGLGAVLFISALLAAPGGCPGITPPPPEAVLAGTWIFLGSAEDTDVSEFLLTIDAGGTPDSVTFQLGENDAIALDAAGFATADGNMVTLSATFGGNTFSLNGTLDGNEESIGGFATLHLITGSATINATRTAATLTRTTTPADGDHPLAGTWELSMRNTRLFELLLAFDEQGAVASIARKIGSDTLQGDNAPAGTVEVSGSTVTLDLSARGSESSRDSVQFTGALGDDEDLLPGTLSLRLSSNEVTLLFDEQPATFVRVAPAPD